MTSRNSTTKTNPKTDFAPLYVNWNLIQAEQMTHLYKFGSLFFPGLTSPSLLKTLLNLENEMSKILLNIPAQERDKLQEGLEGLHLDLNIAVSHEGVGEIISIPIRLEPSAIIKRAILGKGPSVDLEAQLSELKKGLFTFITKEGTRMMKGAIEGFFKGKVKEGDKEAVKELITAGAITKSGKLKSDTTIEDLLVGKYSELFSKAADREIVNEGLIIEQTLMGLYEWGELDMEEWARDVKKDLELISYSLEEMKSP